MGATYNYSTGKIEHDYHFRRWDEKCKLGGLPCYVGSDRCRQCSHYAGSMHSFSTQLRYGFRMKDSWVMCQHKEAKDSENSGEAHFAFGEMMRHNALCALDG